jgi:hypothetical protein
VVDNPVYAQHWAGHRAVQVIFEADAITIRRANADEPEEDGEEEDNGNGRGNGRGKGRGPEAGE